MPPKPRVPSWAPTVVASVGDANIRKLKDRLYEACASKYQGQLVSQEQLLGFGLVPNDNLSTLILCVNALLSERLFTLLQDDGNFVYRVNNRDNSVKYKQLSPDESLVFSAIDNAGRQGLWTRTIKTRTNLHQAVMSRCLKGLESKGLIKSVINIENPTRKIYIEASLQPSEEMTGGPWYNDDGSAELDEEFVRVLSNAAHKFIASRSWIIQREPGTSSSSHRGIKRDSAGVARENTPRAPSTSATVVAAAEVSKEGEEESAPVKVNYLPMPAGYKDYPTAKMIKRHVNASAVTNVVLDDHATEQLLEVLIDDDKIEPVLNKTAYKAVRGRIDGSLEAGAGNGLTEAPCGRCPVFDLCEEGGPVSASKCKYFAAWLEI